eukprot:732492-Rhodomonas_salina.1
MRVSMCLLRSGLTGFSDMRTQDALSSQIGVGPSWTKLRSLRRFRRYTISTQHMLVATNSASAELRVTQDCRLAFHAIGPSFIEMT